jgi:phosphoglycolate phosphatase
LTSAAAPLRALLFDLDGTLVDTAPELAVALNRTLASVGRAAVSDDQVRAWIGDGARALIAKALGGPVPEGLWQTFSAEYFACCGSGGSTLFPGTREMLGRLQAAGIRLAVLTNKEGRFAHKVLAAHDLLAPFDVIVAGDTLAVKKPDPAVVRHALDALQVTADEAALVGDSVTDVRSAHAAGVPAWIVHHGYPAGEFSGSDVPDAWIAGFESFDPQQLGRPANAATPQPIA